MKNTSFLAKKPLEKETKGGFHEQGPPPNFHDMIQESVIFNILISYLDDIVF